MGRVRIVVETLADGLRFTTPDAPNFAAVARTRLDCATAIERCRREADVAAYAARQGRPYDLAEHDWQAEVDSRRTDGESQATASSRFDPAAWHPLPDGRWLSPRRRVYRATTDMARKVVAARRAVGLPTEADPTEASA